MEGSSRENGAAEVPTRYECRLTYRVEVRLPPDADRATAEAAAEGLVEDGFGTLIAVESEAMPGRPE